MNCSRREFLKASSLSAGSVLWPLACQTQQSHAAQRQDWDYLLQASRTIPPWVEAARVKNGPYGVFKETPHAQRPSIESAGMAYITLQTVLGPDFLTEEQRKEWLARTINCQEPKRGMFAARGEQYDVMYSRNAALHCFILGGCPRYPMVIPGESDHKSVKDLITYYETLPPKDISLLARSFVFYYTNYRLGDPKAKAMMDATIDWALKKQNPNTGCWAEDLSDVRTAVIQAFKIYVQICRLVPFPVQYPKRQIDACFQLYKRYPRFPDWCTEWDTAMILNLALRHTDHRREEARKMSMKRILLCKPMYCSDGGFTWRAAQSRSTMKSIGLAVLGLALYADIAGVNEQLKWFPVTSRRLGNVENLDGW